MISGLAFADELGAVLDLDMVSKSFAKAGARLDRGQVAGRLTALTPALCRYDGAATTE